MNMRRTFLYLICISVFSSHVFSQDYRLTSYSFCGNAFASNASSNYAINASVGSAFTGVIQSKDAIIRVQSSSKYFVKNGISTLTKVNSDLPIQYKLDQNYPNPFNPTTKIKYSIPKEGIVLLSIYNILGEKMIVLVNENKSAGSYEAVWNASNFASGIYVCVLNCGSFTSSKKMILLK